MYISEAFETLKTLTEDTFSISDTDDIKGVLDADDDTVEVIDIDAEGVDDLDTNYVGKVILSCNVCNSLQYKDPETIEIDEEEECVDKDVECPVCLCTNGYKIVGKVVEYDDNEVVGAVDEEEIDAVDGDNDEEVDETETIDVVDNDEMAMETDIVKEESLNEDKDYPEYEGLPDDLFTKVYDALVTGSSSAKARNVLDYSFPRFNYEVVTTTKDKATNSYVLNIKLGRKQPAKPIIDVANHFGLRVEKEDNDDPYFTSVYKIYIPADQVVEENLREDFKEVKIVTDDQEMKMTSDESGKVEVTTEPLKKEFYDDESETEIQIDDFDSESFDELTEKYLHEVYDNVKGYTTKKVTAKNNKIKVEGLINFNSNKTKPTCFIFEAHTNRKNKVRFNGQNKQLASRNKAFSLKGRVEENKLVCESLTYNYTIKSGRLNESTKIYGNVKI